MQKNVDWNQMKNFVTVNGAPIQSFKTPAVQQWEVDRYEMFAISNGVECSMVMDADNNNPDFVDYITNYHPTGINY